MKLEESGFIIGNKIIQDVLGGEDVLICWCLSSSTGARLDVSWEQTSDTYSLALVDGWVEGLKVLLIRPKVL